MFFGTESDTTVAMWNEKHVYEYQIPHILLEVVYSVLCPRPFPILLLINRLLCKSGWVSIHHGHNQMHEHCWSLVVFDITSADRFALKSISFEKHMVNGTNVIASDSQSGKGRKLRRTPAHCLCLLMHEKTINADIPKRITSYMIFQSRRNDAVELLLVFCRKSIEHFAPFRLHSYCGHACISRIQNGSPFALSDSTQETHSSLYVFGNLELSRHSHLRKFELLFVVKDLRFHFLLWFDQHPFHSIQMRSIHSSTSCENCLSRTCETILNAPNEINCNIIEHV